MANYQIAGNLPFSGGGKDYASAYQSALQMNSTNYNNILSGFQQTAAQNQAAQQGVQAGYGQLSNDVLGGIQNMDASQRQAINDQYAQQRGRTSQQLINRGLGNSTVQQSVDRGLVLDREKANVALTGQTQGINAQYRSQLGLAGLDYAGRAASQNTAQANQQLQWMNSVNAAYPNASAYAQMAMAKGQSGGGGGVGPGSTTFGGPVKSPVGSGGGGMPNNGSLYGGNQFGYGARQNPTFGTAQPYASTNLGGYYNPSQYQSGGFWDMNSGWSGGGGDSLVNPPGQSPYSAVDEPTGVTPQGDGAPTGIEAWSYYNEA